MNESDTKAIRATCICIIPARGGSKRLPRKNVRNVAGKPMIQWAIEACKNSKYLQNHLIFVSSEDEQILDIAKSLDVSQITRPKRLAEDDVWTQEVLAHAVDCISDYARQEDPETIFPHPDAAVIRVQANSPQVTSEKIDECIEKLITSQLKEVFTVDGQGLEDGAIHVMRSSCVKQRALSVYKGVVETDYIDVHTEQDMKTAEAAIAARELLGPNGVELQRKLRDYIIYMGGKSKKTHTWRISTSILVSYYNLIKNSDRLFNFYKKQNNNEFKDKRVLDLGCGLCVFWPFLQEIGYRKFLGVDLFGLRNTNSPEEITGSSSYCSDAASLARTFLLEASEARIIEDDVRNLFNRIGPLPENQKFDLIFTHATVCTKAGNTGIPKDLFDQICSHYLKSDGISIYNG